MKFTELDLTNFSDLKWITLLELRELYLGAEARPRTTVEQALRDLYKRRHDENDRLHAVDPNSVAAESLRDAVKKSDEQIRLMETKIVIGMREGGQSGIWVGVGSRGLDLQDEIIPRRYWAHLKFDFEDGSAYAGKVRFSGARFLLMDRVPEGHAIRELIKEAQVLPAPDPKSSEPDADESSIGDVENKSPGRPTSKYEVLQEFFFRVMRGDIEESLAKQSRMLSEWLGQAHPKKPQAQPETIAGQLKHEFKAAKEWLDSKPPKNY